MLLEVESFYRNTNAEETPKEINPYATQEGFFVVFRVPHKSRFG